MKASDYIAEVLAQKGIKTVFGHLGGFNADLVDSIYKNCQMEYVMGYHEQASAFAANSYSVLTENVGIATASGAPSACNLVPGVANAFFDSNACLFIVGSVHSKAVRKSEKLRQNAFEEIDYVSLVSGITKYAAKVSFPEDIRYCLEKALYMAEEGRKGPAVLDIPYDVFRADIDPVALKSFQVPTCTSAPKLRDLRPCVELLRKAQKPLILIGGGARSNESREHLVRLLGKVRVPVVASLCGLDVLPHDHPCFVGFIGHYGNRYANFAVANCDCLFILGSRLDERQVGGAKTAFAPDATIVRVDIDDVELGRIIEETHSFHAKVEDFLDLFAGEDFTSCDYSAWQRTLETWKNRYPSYDAQSEKLHPNSFLQALSEYLPENAVVCADVGQTQMCVAQALRLDGARRLLNSGGYGSMGYSLPAAVGAAYASKTRAVVSISGDGGIQMNIQELQAVRRDNLPVTVIVVNNSCLGMIRRLQERIFDNRTVASVEGYSAPNFEAVARAYGLPYTRIESLAQCASLRDVFHDLTPKFVEVVTDMLIENIPEPGAQIDLQTPLLPEVENLQIKRESNV